MLAKVVTVLAVIFALIITGYVFVFFYRSAPPAIDSGITGIAVLGPSCATSLVPIDKTCPGKPYQGKIPIYQDGKIIKTINTTSGGSFFVYLKPGTYTASKEGLSPTASLAPVRFIVEEGQFTELKFQMNYVKW